VRIIPTVNLAGNHIYVTDGDVAFDYHGYSAQDRLLAHHRLGWTARFPGWDCVIEAVDFPLLETSALNQRKMLGPDQYLHNPIPRAQSFIRRFNHTRCWNKARRTMLSPRVA